MVHLLSVPVCPNVHQDVVLCWNALFSPIRSISLAVGHLHGAGDGLHGSGCADERARARLLPHDEESVRTDEHVSIAWLLPERPSGHSHQRAGYEDGGLSPSCGSRYLAYRY
jgi:hypothetical protein